MNLKQSKNTSYLMKTPTPYSRQLRQFQHLSDKINRHLLADAAENLAPKTLNRLIGKLKSMYYRLRQVVSQRTLQRILAGGSLLIGLGSTADLQAQAFTAPVVNPFSLTNPIVYYNTASAADLDNDGDLDILQGDFYGDFRYYQNTGTPTNPAFAAPLLNPFGLDSIGNPVFLDLGDLDGDGDLDVLMGTYYPSNLIYFQNTGSSSAPAFAASPVINPFGLTSPYVFGFPEMVDIDGDGDLDIFAGDASYGLKYYQNTGSAIAPAFAAPVANPFGLTPYHIIPQPSFGDMDGDGDLDLVIGELYGTLNYYENTGNFLAPAFAAAVTNPFGLVQVPSSYTVSPDFADLDNDGDADILCGLRTGDFVYYEDTSSSINQAPVIVGPADDSICLVDTFGPEPLTISDPDNDPFTYFAVSTNQAVIPDANISITGTAPNLMISATPVATGQTDIVVTASDSLQQSNDTIHVVVSICNTAPLVTAPANDTICDINTFGPVPFTASDPQNDPLTLTATSNDQSVVADGNIQITGTAPNYNIAATPSGPGTATITVTADDGNIQTSDAFDLTVDVCIGLEESMFAREITLYPNPVGNGAGGNLLRFEVDLYDAPEEFSWAVSDIYGKTILQGSLPGNQVNYQGDLDVSGLSAGIYLMEFRTGVFRFSRKFSVK